MRGLLRAVDRLRASHARRGLDMVILFVTSRCNSRCGTCFYHQQLNSGDDLTFDELRRLAATMPPFGDLWLSGGEPFLRDDLLEVMALFAERCGVRTVDLPTNGLFPERAVDLAQAFHQRCPGTSLFVNVALDGLGATHDRIRGVAGNYARARETLAALTALRPRLTRLRVHVNTVVTAANLEEMEELGRTVLAEQRVDGHFFQVIRGQALDPALLEVPLAELRRVHAFAEGIHRAYAARVHAGATGLDAWIRRRSYVGTFLAHYRAQQGVLEDGRGWGFPCVAGDGALVIEHDGTVRACELRAPVESLRELDMDYRRLRASAALRDEVEDIAANPCPCTHVCFIHTSLRRSPRHLLTLPFRAGIA